MQGVNGPGGIPGYLLGLHQIRRIALSLMRYRLHDPAQPGQSPKTGHGRQQKTETPGESHRQPQTEMTSGNANELPAGEEGFAGP